VKTCENNANAANLVGGLLDVSKCGDFTTSFVNCAEVCFENVKRVKE